MSEAFVGEIRMFAGNFAPSGWALCDGQLLAISQNDALFSLIGTIYGGDGRTTFGLPDMRGRVPIHQGSGPGLTPRSIGTKAGAENHTLTANEMPSHAHALRGSSAPAGDTSPLGNVPATASGANLYSDAAANAPMAGNMIVDSGGGQRHSNMMPTQCVNFIIALFGVYPSRT